ncbi:MAG: tetratricopeptide repeat protein [Candidatus Acidiferrales bacterium]
MSTRAESVSPPHPAGPWIYRPWLDLLVGCGGWSAPLLAAVWLAPSGTHSWLIAFYFLAIIFNYPHFMATVYRAYHTREDFDKYKFFTLHLTLLLVLTGILLHASYRLLPWVFTLYVYWSPWHYSGQNYGLLLMFVRRSDAALTPGERRWLRAAFVVSYLMLLASFETGGSVDPLILSLGLPAQFTIPARIALGLAFAVCAWFALGQLVLRRGIRAMAAPLTLVSTQFLWFVLPTFLELRSTYQIPQTRYSSGILAVLHSAQYLWITSYYQRRDARAGQSSWRTAGYFLTLVAGGIALFIPGPWLVSYIFRFDFTTSFLIFTALVNIHHFLLDGAIWKLRDSRVASVLIGRTENSRRGQAAGTPTRDPKPAVSAARVLFAPAFRIAVVGLLLLWGVADQVHFALGTDDQNLAALHRAARMNPYDSAVQARIASAETEAGRRGDAVAALTRAVALSPRNAALQHACARAMIADGRYADAYEHYKKMLEIFPRDPDALVNYGLLAARLNRPEEAIDSWQSAVDVDPNQVNAHLYLAEAFDQRGELASAARHWRSFLELAAHLNDPPVAPQQQASAEIQLADDDARLNQTNAALAEYASAISLAEPASDAKLESLALAHLADLQEKASNPQAAAGSYQRGLALDAKMGDPRAEAFDWFNYGQFLRRRGLRDDLAYACFVRAENLLAPGGGEELETVRNARRQVESRLGRKALTVQKNLPVLLAGATNLPTSSF